MLPPTQSRHAAEEDTAASRARGRAQSQGAAGSTCRAWWPSSCGNSGARPAATSRGVHQ
jgi:hypothetical protein